MSKIYLITDTHFFHKKIIEYSGRPENFTEIIGDNLLNLNVAYSDILIHLGDICIGHDEEAHERFIKPLPCKKWLVKGNHDHQSNTWYLNHGWDFIGDQFSAKLFGKIIMFSHAPVKDNGKFELNIHGHFHNNLHRLLEAKWLIEGEKERNEEDLRNLTPKHKLLAIEYTDYKPVLLEDFLK
jgi:calcineurin-like phosphoesterase family protein